LLKAGERLSVHLMNEYWHDLLKNERRPFPYGSQTQGFPHGRGDKAAAH
jgi:hypothetical protein